MNCDKILEKIKSNDDMNDNIPESGVMNKINILHRIEILMGIISQNIKNMELFNNSVNKTLYEDLWFLKGFYYCYFHYVPLLPCKDDILEYLENKHSKIKNNLEI